MTDSGDDLAAFLMHRTVEAGLSEEERVSLFALVAAYQEGDDPSQVTAGLRAAAFHFADRDGYRPEWRPEIGDQPTPLAGPFPRSPAYLDLVSGRLPPD